MTLRAIVHLGLHFAVPACFALLYFRDRWLRAWLIMMATMAVDLDHLLATPIYDANRCSIGFHPLHTWPAILLYSVLLLPKKTRVLGVGLVIHIVLDSIDCAVMG